MVNSLKNPNPIKERHYFAFEIETLSPLNVSNGVDNNTDSDVFKNGNNEVVVPGTSLAGSFRSYLNESPDKENSIFGYNIETQSFSDSKMSSFYISDLVLSNAIISTRDNVKLKEDRTADATGKFDTEIVETGATGYIYLNFIIRENSINSKEYMDIISKIISAINNGYIRLGKKKNRGFGLIKINNIYHRTFSKDDVNKYIEFKKSQTSLISEKNVANYLINDKNEDNNFIKIKTAFDLPSGIIIREYSSVAGEADFHHIKCNNKSVIPGTSFAGVIRNRTLKILTEIGFNNTEQFLNEWFGYVDKKHKTANQSNIIISESIIEGGKDLLRIRNSIDRFTGGTVDGALYNELVHFNGNLTLEIIIRKSGRITSRNNLEINNDKAIIGLLSLVIEDLSNGYAPIGGESNIGYGILKGDGKITCSEDINIDECKKELFKLCN